jgi:hypothetical protein
MDSVMFDRLARSIHARATRRSALGLFAVLGLSGSLGAASAAAAKTCKKGKKPCRKKCIPKQDCCRNADCDKKVKGQVCTQGACDCPAGTKRCGKECVDDQVCCSGGEKGCPYFDVCDDGSCVNCYLDQCFSNEECCTGLCDGTLHSCYCFVGNYGPAGGCTEDRQCCNGACNTQTGNCACDPNGSPCVGNEQCCSGSCVEEACTA